MNLKTGSIKRLTGFTGLAVAVNFLVSLQPTPEIVQLALVIIAYGFTMYQASQTFTDWAGKAKK